MMSQYFVLVPRHIFTKPLVNLPPKPSTLPTSSKIPLPAAIASIVLTQTMSTSSSSQQPQSQASSSMASSMPSLADICDDHISSPQRLSVVEPGHFFDYGKIKRFYGKIETVRCFESNPMVRTALSTAGENKVLIVDGGSSKRVAILGDQITQLAVDNQWAGIIVNGCIRDSAIIQTMEIGVKALGTHPVKSLKTYPGERGVTVNFGGVEFVPGHWVYADEDGIIVSEKPLHKNQGTDSKL